MARLYQVKRSSFNGMSARLGEAGSFNECRARLGVIAKKYRRAANRFNCDVQWLKPWVELEITDEGLGLIGDHHGVYHIVEVPETRG